jgi:hypothetical protein
VTGVNRPEPVITVSMAFTARRALGTNPSPRRISSNTCGVISLTFSSGGFKRWRSIQTRQQIGQPTEIVIAEMGAASADHDRRINGPDISPLARQAGELSRVVVEVDAILAPRLTTID